MRRYRSVPGVIITVYVESSRERSLPPRKKTKQIRGHVGGRKAQLLDYARELRRGRDGWQRQRRRKPHAKKWKWLTVPARLKMPWTWRYQRLAAFDSEADKGINQRRRRRRTRPGRSHYKFWRKLKLMCKKLSHGWQCYKD